MPRTLDIIDRELGERCCDIGARPSRTYKEAESVSEAFDLMAHPVRLQLIDVLARNEGRVCVCDLEAAVPVKQPTVSHHLRILREAGVVSSEKVGQWVYYHIRRDRAAMLHDLMRRALATLGGEEA